MRIDESHIQLMLTPASELILHGNGYNSRQIDTRLCNTLYGSRIIFIAQLYAYGESKILEIRGLGLTSLRVIKRALSAMKLPDLPIFPDTRFADLLNETEKDAIETKLREIFNVDPRDPVNDFLRAALPPSQASDLTDEFLKRVKNSAAMKAAIRGVIHQELAPENEEASGPVPAAGS